jgi:hypothetical protein
MVEPEVVEANELDRAFVVTVEEETTTSFEYMLIILLPPQYSSALPLQTMLQPV